MSDQKQTSLAAPEPPQELWLAYDSRGPWWEFCDRSAPDAVRYIRADLVTETGNAR